VELKLGTMRLREAFERLAVAASCESEKRGAG
jgi:hypothetical protein